MRNNTETEKMNYEELRKKVSELETILAKFKKEYEMKMLDIDDDFARVNKSITNLKNNQNGS